MRILNKAKYRVEDDIFDMCYKIISDSIRSKCVEIVTITDRIERIEKMGALNTLLMSENIFNQVKHLGEFIKSDKFLITIPGYHYIRLDKSTILIVHVYNIISEQLSRSGPGPTTINQPNSNNTQYTLYFIGKNRTRYRTRFNEYARFIKNRKVVNPIVIRYSDVRRYDTITGKSFNTIFGNDLSDITSHLDKWGKSRPLFVEFEITHKIGILLYGPPGTGKTSVVKAIALKYNKPIKYINLDDDIDVIIKVLENERDSIILLEDIDTCMGETDITKMSESKEAKYGMLLNILDGVYSSEGCIYIATTNHIEKLRPELLRDGRFDIKKHVDNINKEAAIEMVKHFKGSLKLLDNETFPINPAYLQNKIMKYRLEKRFGKNNNL